MRINILISIAILSCIAPQIKADSYDIPPVGDVKKIPSGKGHRDIPSPTPTCYISGGVLNVVSPDDWSYATVTLVEASTGIQSVNAGFLDEGIEVYIPSTTGNFTFTIVTESGDEFIGSFTL